MATRLDKEFARARRRIIRCIKRFAAGNSCALVGKKFDMKFYSDRFDADVFGSVMVSQLYVHRSGNVMLRYSVPAYCEENSYYITDDDGDSGMNEMDIAELSLDELYNLANLIKERELCVKENGR